MKKKIHLSVAFGLICAVLLSLTQFNVLCDDLRENVLRLHIKANSNSVADQEVKIKIRDEILAKTQTVFLDADTLIDAEEKVQNNLSQFKEIADEVLKENGFDYTAAVGLGDTFFETRHYDTFSLPAGNYRSLIIDLGKAEGENWWCVVFPTVCVPAAVKGELTDSVSEKSALIAQNSSKFVMRFKVIEIYEKIKNYFD